MHRFEGREQRKQYNFYIIFNGLSKHFFFFIFFKMKFCSLMSDFDFSRHWSFLPRWLFWKRKWFGLKNKLCILDRTCIRKLSTFHPRKGAQRIQLIQMPYSRLRITNQRNAGFQLKMRVTLQFPQCSIEQLFLVSFQINSI